MQKPTSFGTGNYSVGSGGASPELVAAMRRVYDKHGPSAFDMPKFDAAIHETGHAIIYLVEGEPVLELAIYPKRFNGRQQWGGEAKSGLPWFADSRSDPSDDLRRARFTIAGLAAEALYHRGKQQKGSSLDEVDAAQKLCAIAGPKLGRDAGALYAEQFQAVTMVLMRFWPEALQLAAALEKKQTLVGPKLAIYLQPIREALR